MDPVVLRTDRLVLSAATEADIDTITELCQDRAMVELLAALPWPYTRADAEHFVRGIVTPGWMTGDELIWGIRETDDGPHLGSIGWHPSRGEIGYWMGAPYRGRGYMGEAAREVCRWVFAELGVDRIGWEAHVGNVASARVARSLGFRYDGVHESAVCERDGVRPAAWHGHLLASHDGALQPGWPL